jgi:hypothetical protein
VCVILRVQGQHLQCVHHMVRQVSDRVDSAYRDGEERIVRRREPRSRIAQILRLSAKETCYLKPHVYIVGTKSLCERVIQGKVKMRELKVAILTAYHLQI